MSDRFASLVFLRFTAFFPFFPIAEPGSRLVSALVLPFFLKTSVRYWDKGTTAILAFRAG